MTTIGSLCEDCVQFGLQNYLKPFYINLDEQIIKCESSNCMFPYLRKPILSDLTNSKPSENSMFLDELLEQSLKQIDDTPSTSKQAIQLKYQTKIEKDTSDVFDFSTIFMDHPIKTETKEKPLIIVKQENKNAQPVIFDSKVIQNSSNSEDLKPKINSNIQIKSPKKSRISKCLIGVKSNSRSTNVKRKQLGERIEPVLVVEPNSGKSMRPLDLIKRYMKK